MVTFTVLKFGNEIKRCNIHVMNMGQRKKILSSRQESNYYPMTTSDLGLQTST